MAPFMQLMDYVSFSDTNNIAVEWSTFLVLLWEWLNK